MIENDLLGISVNDLIKNYCVLYDKEEKKTLGITKISIAKEIDKTYGNEYEIRYIFVDIFAIDVDTIKQNKILSYYEVQKILEEYIGWTPNSFDVNLLAAFLHTKWIDFSKSSTTLLIDLIKILKKYENILDANDVKTIKNTQSQIDYWQKQWSNYQFIDDDSLKKEYKKEACKILKKIHKRRENDYR